MTLDAARAAFARGDFEETLALATRALESVPDEARLLRINAALKLERWQVAADDLRWLIEKRGKNPKLSQTLSECWVRIGNAHKTAQPETALAAYRRAIDANPENGSARFNLAVVLASSAHRREAIEALDACLATDPSDVEAMMLLAEQRIALGEEAAALATLRSMPDSMTDEQRRRAAMLLIEGGATQDAVTLAGRLASPSPDWTLAFAAKLRAFGAVAQAFSVKK